MAKRAIRSAGQAGTRPPPAPKKDMTFWVQWGSSYSLGTAYGINKVNTRSFYVSGNGRQDRYLLVEWNQWLARRFAEGKVYLKGKLLAPPPTLNLPSQVAESADEVDPVERDRRFFRAAKEVLGSYDLERVADGPQEVEYLITGGTDTYRVYLRTDWSAPPRCTCPDARTRSGEPGGAFCKHSIAVLLQDDEHRGQLLELLL